MMFDSLRIVRLPLALFPENVLFYVPLQEDADFFRVERI